MNPGVSIRHEGCRIGYWYRFVQPTVHHLHTTLRLLLCLRRTERHRNYSRYAYITVHRL
jgi:hypothetical protein